MCPGRPACLAPRCWPGPASGLCVGPPPLCRSWLLDSSGSQPSACLRLSTCCPGLPRGQCSHPMPLPSLSWAQLEGAATPAQPRSRLWWHSACVRTSIPGLSSASPLQPRCSAQHVGVGARRWPGLPRSWRHPPCPVPGSRGPRLCVPPRFGQDATQMLLCGNCSLRRVAVGHGRGPGPRGEAAASSLSDVPGRGRPHPGQC